MMFYFFFLPIEKARELFKENKAAGATPKRGICYAEDGVEMRFYLFGTIAYVKPPSGGDPAHKGVWIAKRLLSFLNPQFSD